MKIELNELGYNDTLMELLFELNNNIQDPITLEELITQLSITHDKIVVLIPSEFK